MVVCVLFSGRQDSPRGRERSRDQESGKACQNSIECPKRRCVSRRGHLVWQPGYSRGSGKPHLGRHLTTKFNRSSTVNSTRYNLVPTDYYILTHCDYHLEVHLVWMVEADIELTFNCLLHLWCLLSGLIIPGLFFFNFFC